MEIGFLTGCLRHRPLTEIIEWAGANGFTSLELASWPREHQVDATLDVVDFTQAKADELNAFARQHGIKFTCLTYCENTITGDLNKRNRIVEHLYRIMDAAPKLGVNTVCTFVGRDATKTQAENFDEMTRVFTPLIEYAAARNLRIAIENCPMPGWDFEGLPGNLAYSPLIWDEMFRRMPQANFGLNLDPSHLVWLGVDIYDAVKQYASRIFYSHAKDTQIFYDKRAYNSILNSGWNSWWTYRLPGKGEIDWARWSDTLRQNGYDGVLSIEHEDPEYEHTEELIKEGLLLGQKNLREALGRG
ncbi:MAG TPA: sugar phosphate isomerase/epimerase [Anaerolineae bacterium]|nr:sugar phosphate isomerase/epimerase [Anaerolineae bacterium]